MNNNQRKDSAIAAGVTFIVAFLVLLFLFFGSLKFDRAEMAQSSTPEIMNDEPLFLEPELMELSAPGTDETEQIEEAAPEVPGEPDPALVEQLETRVASPKPVEKPKPEPKPVVTSKQENDVKRREPKATAEEEKRVQSMQGKFKTDNNGSRHGKESEVSGAGGDGVSTSGKLNGRKMLSCPSSKVKITQKSVVTVRITVDANGNVTAVSAQSGGTPNLRKVCEGWARQSKWTPKPGAAPASGTITFTIVPK